MKICNNNFSFKLKPYPHLLLLTKYKKPNTAKTYANIIIMNHLNKDDIPLYKHELEHVRQFYRLFLFDFTLFNKCKKELNAYTVQIKEELKINNYDRNKVNIEQYLSILYDYCEDKEEIYNKFLGNINLFLFRYRENKRKNRNEK